VTGKVHLKEKEIKKKNILMKEYTQEGIGGKEVLLHMEILTKDYWKAVELLQILFPLLLFVGALALYFTGRRKRDDEDENNEE